MPFKKGHVPSPETRAKLSRAGCGRKLSLENRAKLRAAQTGPNNNRWNGGKVLTVAGYVRILCPSHPHADCNGYVLEHRLVMEAHLGRTLLVTEVVHHINGIKTDNRIQNLLRFDSLADHQTWHREAQRGL